MIPQKKTPAVSKPTETTDQNINPDLESHYTKILIDSVHYEIFGPLPILHYVRSKTLQRNYVFEESPIRLEEQISINLDVDHHAGRGWTQKAKRGIRSSGNSTQIKGGVTR